MNFSKKIVLASGSPRRKQIFQEAGFIFDVKVIPTDESFSTEMPPEDVPEYLALQKAKEFSEFSNDYVIVSADTVVIVNNQILNKPKDESEARAMLKLLSNASHRVITGVCIKTNEKFETFSDTTIVHFAELSDQEIDYYLETYKPYDKAGAYGVQEFIGMIGITKLEGSFYTVMGLPIHKVYQKLKHLIALK